MTEIRPRAVRPSEIEALYHLSHSSLWRLMRQPGFPAYRVGRLVGIPLSEFDAWLKAQSVEVVGNG